MTDAWAIVISAAIPVVASGIAFVIKLILDTRDEQRRELRELRDENRTDHGIVMNAIIGLSNDIKDLKKDQQDHFKWHSTQTGSVTRRRKH